MFDQLVESAGKGKAKRTGVFLLTTTAIYGVALLAVAIGTIFYFSPQLMGSFNVKAMLEPPPPPAPEASPPEQMIARNVTEVPEFQPPKNVKVIPAATEVPPKYFVSRPAGVPGGVPGSTPGGSPGPVTGEEVPPPPPPPSVTPTPAPTPRPVHKVSGGVTQGLALRRVTPTYPAIARTARVTGTVTIQVLISEEGKVLLAEVISGHPLLQDAALQAAKQWVFKPTELSKVPVKVQGVLTFNFVL
jgi:periplasmic protein TonB